jgi:outer membrane protein OmpA-like peptidoglycan-associated protein
MPAMEWSTPKRLPRTINTPKDENFPSFDKDTLYFSSDGHGGVGGLDILRTYPIGSDGYATPFNLLPPVNSGADDFGISFSPKLNSEGRKQGYFSSSRGDGLDRIYEVEQLPPPPPPVPEIDPIDSTIIVKTPSWILDIVVVEPILSIPDNPGSRVVGVKPLESATIEVDPASFTENLVVIEPGEWNLSLAENTQYRFLAKAPGYLSQDESFSTIGMKKVDGAADQRFELEIQLNKIYAGREIVLDDIYYDFDKSDIRSDAEPTLRELARDLQLNPELRIRLGSHTDCRGGDAYNRALSQRRAESAVQFLIDQGIDASRLEAVGFGEDVARTDCACSRCTEEDHQLNRRTTFAILE